MINAPAATSRRWPRIPALALWLLSVALLAATTVVIVTDRSRNDHLDLAAVSVLVFVLSCATVGALVAARRPDLPTGWLLLAAGLGYAFAGFATSAVHLVHSARSVFLYLDVISGWVWGVSLGLVVLLLLRFPDGKLLSRRWRVVEWVTIASLVAFAVGNTVQPGRVEQTRFPNPLGVGGPVGTALGHLAGAFGLAIIAMILALVSVVLRYRRSGRIEREQLKWILYAVVVLAVSLAADFAIGFGGNGQLTTDIENVISTLAISFVPVAIGIAILRYRLFDIDRLINRTIVYALLTVLLLGVYAALVVGLGAITGRTGNPVVIAGSTLVVAALFGPARRRIQALIDRRFFRRRYDAERVLAAFSTRLRDELDLESLSNELRGAVREAVQPNGIAVWIRGMGEDR
jgi:hypothetical protein